MSADLFWNSTLKDVTLASKAYDNSILKQAESQRQLEWTILQTAITMDGKQVYRKFKSPKDLYSLPGDIKEKKIKANSDPKRALAAYKRSLEKRASMAK